MRTRGGGDGGCGPCRRSPKAEERRVNTAKLFSCMKYNTRMYSNARLSKPYSPLKSPRSAVDEFEFGQWKSDLVNLFGVTGVGWRFIGGTFPLFYGIAGGGLTVGPFFVFFHSAFAFSPSTLQRGPSLRRAAVSLWAFFKADSAYQEHSVSPTTHHRFDAIVCFHKTNYGFV